MIQALAVKAPVSEARNAACRGHLTQPGKLILVIYASRSSLQRLSIAHGARQLSMSTREVCRSLCLPRGQLGTPVDLVGRRQRFQRTADPAKLAAWRQATAPPAAGAAAKGRRRQQRSTAAAGLRSSLSRLLNLEGEEAVAEAGPAGISKEVTGSDGGEATGCEAEAMAAHEVDAVYECQRFFGPIGW